MNYKSNFIQRDYNRTVHDDYVLNVEPQLSEHKEAIPVLREHEIVGWKIQNQYE